MWQTQRYKPSLIIDCEIGFSLLKWDALYHHPQSGLAGFKPQKMAGPACPAGCQLYGYTMVWQYNPVMNLER